MNLGLSPRVGTMLCLPSLWVFKIRLVLNFKNYSSPIQDGKREEYPCNSQTSCENTNITQYETAMKFNPTNFTDP